MNVALITDESNLKSLLELLQIYEAEFSKITGKKPNQDGTYKLDVDLTKTDNYFLLMNEEPIGFCIKGVFDGRHDIFEFYILPHRRGKKLGRTFAKEIFKKYKGPWQVRQIEGADKAISFWRKAIGEFAENRFEESIIEDAYWGKVTRQVFNSV